MSRDKSKQIKQSDSTQLAFNMLEVMPEDIFKEVSVRCDVNSILRMRQVSRRVGQMVEQEYPSPEDFFDEYGFWIDHAEIINRAKRCREIEDQLPGLRASLTWFGKFCHVILPPNPVGALETQRKRRLENRVKLAAVIIGALAMGFAVNFAAPVTAVAFSIGMISFGFEYIKKIACIVAKKIYNFVLKHSKQHADKLDLIADLEYVLQEKKAPFIEPIREKQVALREQIDLGRQLVDELDYEGRRPGFRVS